MLVVINKLSPATILIVINVVIFCYSVSSSEIRWALHLHYNPVEAGFVWEAEHYCYSPAFDYAGGKGYLEVDLIQ